MGYMLILHIDRLTAAKRNINAIHVQSYGVVMCSQQN